MSAVIEDLPETLEGEEEYGKAMPSRNHAIAQFRLGTQFLRHPEFEIASEMTLELNGRRFTPDLVVFPKRPIDWIHDVVRETEAPLSCVEIFSPQQGYLEVMEKVTAYLEAGVKSCWVLVPPLQTVTIYLPGEPPQTTSLGIARDPATGLEADVSEVFA